MDHAVAYVVMERLWKILTGPILLYLIAIIFSKNTQGYYYTFLSLLNLQVLAELGFFIVIIQFSSHEWAQLKLDENGSISGDNEALSRLISLGRLAFKWYAGAAGFILLCLSIGGYWFFQQKPDEGVLWQAPWISAVLFSALQLWIFPFTSMLEGCGQIAQVSRFRFLKAVMGSIAMVSVLILGGELWAVSAVLAGGLVVDIYLVTIRYHKFFKPFFSMDITTRFCWKTDIWPMQWRVSMGIFANLATTSLFTPVMFHYYGSVIAGQTGMTWQVISLLNSLSAAWVTTKTPLYGNLIAQTKYTELDRLFFRNSFISLLVLLSGGIALVGFVYWLNITQHALSERALSTLPTILFLIAAFGNQISGCLSAYIRAHKKDPMVTLMLVSGLLTILLTWIFGSRFGPMGMAGSYMAITMLVFVPWELKIWSRCRREWH